MKLSNDFITKKAYEIDYKRNDTMLQDMKVLEKKAIQGVNNLNDYVEVLKRKIDKKVDMKMYDHLADSLDKFVVFEDLKDLYDKTIPPLENFTQQCEKF
jgi:hypothetical protein